MNCASALTNPALDILPLPACNVDAQGHIACANRAWLTLTSEIAPLHELGVAGVDFVAACERATGLDGAAALATGVRQLLSNQQSAVSLLLVCGDSAGRRWLEPRAARLPGDPAGCLVTCEDITERRKAVR